MQLNLFFEVFSSCLRFFREVPLLERISFVCRDPIEPGQCEVTFFHICQAYPLSLPWYSRSQISGVCFGTAACKPPVSHLIAL